MGTAIKTKYLRLARTYHPDKGGSARRFQYVTIAEDTLCQDGRRRLYDIAWKLLHYATFTYVAIDAVVPAAAAAAAPAPAAPAQGQAYATGSLAGRSGAVERVRTSPSPEAPAVEPALDEEPALAEEPAPVEEAAPSEPDDPPPVTPTEEELAEMAAEMIKIEAEIEAEQNAALVQPPAEDSLNPVKVDRPDSPQEKQKPFYPVRSETGELLTCGMPCEFRFANGLIGSCGRICKRLFEHETWCDCGDHKEWDGGHAPPVPRPSRTPLPPVKQEDNSQDTVKESSQEVDYGADAMDAVRTHVGLRVSYQG